jgi:hypothetical protein
MLTCKIGELADKIFPFVDVDIPVCVAGWTGIGKTEIISGPLMHMIEHKYGPSVLHDIRFAQRDPVDASGVPIVDKEKLQTLWTRPGLIPHDDGKMHVFYFGEAGHIDPMRQHVLYQPVNERAMGGYAFPKLNRVILDMNTREDKGSDLQLLKPFQARMLHVFAELDHAGWLRYQKERDCDRRLIAFLKLKGEYMHYMLKRDNDGRVIEPNGPAFPTPRSIERIDRLHKAGYPNDVIVDGARGLCGEAFARDYALFLKHLADNLPKLSEIRANPTGAKVPSDLDEQWLIAGSVAHAITAADAHVWAQYLARLAADIAARAAHTAIQKTPSLGNIKALTDLR